MKVLQCGFYRPTIFKDAHSFVMQCDICQRSGNISKKHEMPLHKIMKVELFDVCGINSWDHSYLQIRISTSL